jgi:hypothetical protein
MRTVPRRAHTSTFNEALQKVAKWACKGLKGLCSFNWPPPPPAEQLKFQDCSAHRLLFLSRLCIFPLSESAALCVCMHASPARFQELLCMGCCRASERSRRGFRDYALFCVCARDICTGCELYALPAAAIQAQPVTLCPPATAGKLPACPRFRAHFFAFFSSRISEAIMRLAAIRLLSRVLLICAIERNAFASSLSSFALSLSGLARQDNGAKVY